MAQHARLEKARLVVKRRHARRAAKTGCRVALQAKQVDVAQFQHVGIWSTVRQMARLAALNLNGRMFVNKRTLLVRVAFEADRILRGGSPHLLRFDCAVYVVAIAALNQTLIDPVVKGHFEFSFLVEVAAVTKFRLSFHQQELFCGRVVWGMAGDATDVIPRMLGVDRVHMLRAAGVAGQAALVDLLGGMILEDEDLSFVAASGDVGSSRAVAAFASLMRWAAFCIERRLPVRRLLPAVVNSFVAGFASFCSDVIGGTCGRGGWLVLGRHWARMSRARGLRVPGSRPYNDDRRGNENHCNADPLCARAVWMFHLFEDDFSRIDSTENKNRLNVEILKFSPMKNCLFSHSC